MQYQNPDPRFESLVGQLNSDGIAFETVNDGTGRLEQSLFRTLEDAHEGTGHNVGLVFLDSTPPHVPNLRDLAQDLHLATGIETIYIRTPDVAIAASEKFHRSALEAGQLAAVQANDCQDGVARFLQEVSTQQLSWPLTPLAIAAVLILACAATVAQSVRQA